MRLKPPLVGNDRFLCLSDSKIGIAQSNVQSGIWEMFGPLLERANCFVRLASLKIGVPQRNVQRAIRRLFDVLLVSGDRLVCLFDLKIGFGTGTGIAVGFGRRGAIGRMRYPSPSPSVSPSVFFRWFSLANWFPSEDELAQDRLLPCFLRHFSTGSVRSTADGPLVRRCGVG